MSAAEAAGRRGALPRLLAATTALAVGALGAAAACSAARPPPCPGDPIGTFRFHAEPITPAECPFATDAGLDFTATVAYTGETAAVLCVERAEAQPLVGTRVGDHLTLSGPSAAAGTLPCVCAVEIAESVEGDVERSDAGVTGFTGELRDALAPADGGDPAACEPADTTGGARCGVPCQLRWRLAGSR